MANNCEDYIQQELQLLQDIKDTLIDIKEEDKETARLLTLICNILGIDTE